MFLHIQIFIYVMKKSSVNIEKEENRPLPGLTGLPRILYEVIAFSHSNRPPCGWAN